MKIYEIIKNGHTVRAFDTMEKAISTMFMIYNKSPDELTMEFDEAHPNITNNTTGDYYSIIVLEVADDDDL